MKERTRKVIVLLFTMLLLVSLLSGCGKKEEKKSADSEETAEAAGGSGTDAPVSESRDSLGDRESSRNSAGDDLTTDPSESDYNDISREYTLGAESGRITNATYVMIYNPLIYDELDDSKNRMSTLSTGSLGPQIVTGMNRSDDLQGITYPVMVSPKDVSKGADEVELPEGDKAGTHLHIDYAVGYLPSFYIYDTTFSYRSLKKFQCIYEGEYCYIFDFYEGGSVSDEDAKMLADEFDNKIFNKDTTAFGKGRFTDNGGKVCVLMQPMQDGLAGFFCQLDLFDSNELNPGEKEQYGINTNNAIININSNMLSTNPDFVKSTLAHEYQHLISATDAFEKGTFQTFRTWLDETMSAYAEENVYPGIKKANYFDLNMFCSENFINGQSLYNFDTYGDDWIGAYGAVYLFGQYLRRYNDEDVFYNIHSAWRNSLENVPDEASFIQNSVTFEFEDVIDTRYEYPADVEDEFESEEEMWLSKLTLDFYLDSLQVDLGEYESDAHLCMLYSSVNPCEIEGGGNVIVALSGNAFTIPEDADDNLMYIGLDSQFNPVTGIVTK